MSIEPTTTETPTDDPPKAQIMPMNVGLTAAHRCDRCGAQAYYEAEVNYLGETEDGRLVNKKGTLLFCAHHAAEHHDQGPRGGLMASQSVTRIYDHRPALEAAEKS